MRVIIDMQALQGESRKRGIGRFTKEFTRALQALKPADTELIFLFNLYLSSPLLEQEDDLEYMGISKDEADFWISTGETNWRDQKNTSSRIVSEYLLTDKIRSLKANALIIPSLFEGYFDNCVTLVPETKAIKTIVFNHDLIPAEDDTAQNLPNFADYYRTKLNQLSSADLILTPSKWTKAKTWELIGSEAKEKTKVIYEGISSIFLGNSKDKRNSFNESKSPYFLTLGINDSRKGIDKVLAAYAMLPPHTRNIVRIKALTPKTKDIANHVRRLLELHKLPPSSVDLVGHLDDKSLCDLYADSTALLFLSAAEGFGLPVLEAIGCGTAVIASNCTAIPEVTGCSYQGLVDREDPNQIASLMQKVLNAEFRYQLIKQGRSRLPQFTWEKSAQKAWESILMTCQSQAHNSSTITKSPDIERSEIDARISKLSTLESNRAIACQYFNRSTETVGRKIFVDISEIIKHDAASGVQRVTRHNILYALSEEMRERHPTLEICFCFANTSRQGYFVAHARESANYILKYEKTQTPIAPRKGDIFFGLDLQHDVVIYQGAFLDMIYSFGVNILFLVHDLLPLTHPNFFHHNTEDLHKKWIKAVSRYDGAICVSESTKERLREYLRRNNLLKHGYRISVSLNGSDPSLLSAGSMTAEESSALESIATEQYCLIVGTVEPRKGIDEVLDGFANYCWKEEKKIWLVIAGKRGWLSEQTEIRMTRLREQGYPILRLQSVSDALLSELYKNASLLIAASYDEGFGLPLIEALSFDLPIIARDIGVFREVGGDNAAYIEHFDSPEMKAMIDEIQRRQKNSTKRTAQNHRQWIGWQESCRRTFRAAVEMCMHDGNGQ